VAGFSALLMRFLAGQWFILGVKDVFLAPVYPRVLSIVPIPEY